MFTRATLPSLSSAMLLAALLVSLAAEVLADPLPPPLPDQFGELSGLDPQAAVEQLVIVVSAKRLRRLKPWERELREQYPDLPILRVADVPVSGSADADAVAEKLRKRLPEDVAVLMDLDGVWAEAYQLDTSVPNLLLFSADLELLVQHSGFYRRAEFDSFREALDAVLTAPVSLPDNAPQATYLP